MTRRSTPLSAIGRNLRLLAREKWISYAEAAGRIKFADNSPEGALELLLEEYERDPTPALLETIGDLYVTNGSKVAAQGIFKGMYLDGMPLHVTNLIYAGLPATNAIVDDNRKLLYIPIPKCGSTTVKNYFTAAMFGETYGEMVHFRHPELTRQVTAEEMATTYADYYRFTVVRDPLSRLVSYYTRNILENSLRREARQQDSFLGLPTRPGPNQYASNFFQYRSFFKDFRHHTDPICGYLEPFGDNIDRIYSMDDLGELRAHMSDLYNVEIHVEREMASKDNQKARSQCAEAIRPVAEKWFARDYELYFSGQPSRGAAQR